MPAEMTINKMQCNGDKTLFTELVPVLARNTALMLLGNKMEPGHEIRKRRENATKTFTGLIRKWSRHNDISTLLKMQL